MKRIQSKAGLLKRRVGEVHSRAKFVGFVYLFATIALAVVATVYPLLQGVYVYQGNDIPVVLCYNKMRALFDLGFDMLFQSPTYIMLLAQLLTYFIMLLILYVNVLRALSKLNWLCKKRASYINGFNRNMYAMDAIGKRFTSSFAALLICNVLFAWLTIRSTVLVAPQPVLAGYITLGAALLVRFVIGSLQGTVPLFTTGAKIIEKKRDHGVFIYFVRNLLQVAFIGGIAYFLAQASGFSAGLYNMLREIIVEENKLYLIHIDTIPVYAELAALICLMVMIRHASASTEYNRDCNHGIGMKNFAIFAGILTVLCGALIAFPFVGIGLPDGAKATWNMPMLWAAVIAFVGCLFDSIFRARDKKRVEEETDEDPVPGEEEEEEDEQPQAPYGWPIQVQMPQPYPYPAASAPAQNAQQPIFVPIFYGYPQGGVMQQPIMPMPAPQYLLPMPSPATAAAEAIELKEEKEPKEPTETTVEDLEMNPHRKYKVYCPSCGKALMARDVSPYHRCPACDKVFQLRKFKTYTKGE